MYTNLCQIENLKQRNKNAPEVGDSDSMDLERRNELAEPLVLLADLEGELAGVTHHQHGDLTVHRLDLLQGGQHEHGSLPHTGLGLTEDIHPQDCLHVNVCNRLVYYRVTMHDVQ